jgi:hypothetical protein
MSSIGNNTIIGINNVRLIRKSRYHERRKLLPTSNKPKSLIDALDFVSNCDILICQNEKMTYVYTTKLLLLRVKKILNFYVIVIMNIWLTVLLHTNPCMFINHILYTSALHGPLF